jgi:hypothetical protein
MLQYFFDDKYLNVRLTTIYVLTKMKNKHVNGYKNGSQDSQLNNMR